MSKVINNVITEGLSGKIGDKHCFVQTSTGKTIIRRLPKKSSQVSEAQLAQRAKFTLAMQQAREALQDPVQKTAFEAKTKKGCTIFGTAMKHFYAQING